MTRCRQDAELNTSPNMRRNSKSNASKSSRGRSFKSILTTPGLVGKVTEDAIALMQEAFRCPLGHQPAEWGAPQVRRISPAKMVAPHHLQPTLREVRVTQKSKGGFGAGAHAQTTTGSANKPASSATGSAKPASATTGLETGASGAAGDVGSGPGEVGSCIINNWGDWS